MRCLKESYKCTCGKDALVILIKKEKGEVLYRCNSCKKEYLLNYNEVINDTGHYDCFIFNEDGTLCWKCSEHGGCDIDICEDEEKNSPILNAL